VAAQLLRFSPESHAQEVRVLFEGLLTDGTWQPLLTVTPDIKIFGRDTLNFDMFTSHAAWHESEEIPNGIVLRGSDNLTKVTTQITVHSHDMLRVETRVTLRRGARLETVKDRLSLLDFDFDHAWTPHQTPLPEMVIGDAVFRSPAIVLQKGARTIALIPNLKILASHRIAPTAMTLDAETCEMAYGCIPYRLSRNTYYVHYDTDTVDLNSILCYSYFVYYQNDCRPKEGIRRLVHRIWRLYAESRAAETVSQQIPLGEQLSRIAREARQFWMNGMPTGSMTGELDLNTEAEQTTDVSQIPPVLCNDVQSCAAHSAYGLALYALRTKNDECAHKARNVIAHTLQAPQKDGLFPVIFRNDGHPAWHMGGIAGPDNKDTLCRLTNCSWTGYWLCRWYQDIEKDPALLSRVTAYAKKILTLQKHGGHIPAWIHPESGKTVRICAKTAEVAVHALFFNELYAITGDNEYLRGARRTINFVVREIAADGRWENTETYYGNSPAWKEKKPFKRDPRQHTHSSHALAMWWTAEALIRLYQTTGTARYLSEGQRVLDELSLYQQIWDPPWFDTPCFGGFGLTNTDGHWNDAIQSSCAKTYLDYYRACGLTEYFYRGVTALRAAYYLLNPENSGTGTFLASHCYLTSPGTTRTGYDTETVFEKAAGPALCAGELVHREYGDLYVDTRRKQAFGLNGILVNQCQADLAGLAVSGCEVLGHARDIMVRTESGHSFTVHLNQHSDFEVQV
jgi:hypothetical protein